MQYFTRGILAVLFLGGSFAFGDTITFVTPGGSTDTVGDPVSAQAVVTTGDGTIAVSLTNNTTNFKDAGQLLSDFSFTLSGSNFGTLTGGSGSGSLINVDANGNVTAAGSTTSAGWNLSATAITGGVTVTLEGLGGGQPKDLVIGPACAGGTYCDANGSIAGNGPHNPFVVSPLTFSLDLAGVTSDTLISDSVFSFGTDLGDNIPGTPQTPVPEPASFALAGLALIAIGCARKRLFRRNS